jgi:hypothetical protein
MSTVVVLIPTVQLVLSAGLDGGPAIHARGIVSHAASTSISLRADGRFGFAGGAEDDPKRRAKNAEIVSKDLGGSASETVFAASARSASFGTESFPKERVKSLVV